MVYDTEFGRIVMFGGIIVDPTSPDTYRPVADTWAYDLAENRWTKLALSSHPWMSATDIGRDDALVGFGPMAYDAESDAVVYFKSIVDDYDDPTPGSEASPANETWALQGAKQQWVLKGNGVARAPSAGRFGPLMAYDSQSDRIILFGGWTALTDGAFPQDTWAYDYNTNAWEEMSPSTSPPGRNYHRMVYDPNTDRVILFGGFPLSGAFDDMWAYDYNMDTWTPLEPVEAPSPRGYHAMAYDEQARQIVLFGGVNAPAETPNAETWVFDPAANAWTRASPSLSPSPRGWHDMVYDPSTRRIVLFGGGPDRFHPNGEVWSHDVSTASWTALSRPSAPLALTAVPADALVELSWLPPASSGGVPITNYRIYRGTQSEVLALLIEVGNVLSYADNTVTNAVTYYYQVSAVTAAGEGERSIERFTTPLPTPDTADPTIAILSPVHGATLTSTVVTVSGEASDNVAIERVELSKDGVTWTRTTDTTTWSGTLTLAEGPNTIYARATDTSGNSESASVDVTVVVEPTDGTVLGPTILDFLASPVGLATIAVSVGAIGAASWLVVRRRRMRPPET